MASSSIGLYELDYADLPFNVNGDNLIVKRLILKNKSELLLISGVKNNDGMMRGEETQAIGFEDYLKPFNESILILPGTHSKHLEYKNGNFIDLKSFMTGELFEILSLKSILSNSVTKNTNTIFKDWFLILNHNQIQQNRSVGYW